MKCLTTFLANRARGCRIAIFCLLLVAGSPAWAASVSTEVPFELGKWVEFEEVDGGVTLHRIRIVEKKGKLKSKIFRPGNAEYLMTIQIQVEYSNDTDRDIDADLRIHWLDSEGRLSTATTTKKNSTKTSVVKKPPLRCRLWNMASRSRRP